MRLSVALVWLSLGSLSLRGAETPTAGKSSGPASAISQVRDLDTWIDLSGAARPVQVLCPEQPHYLSAARLIADALQRLGAPRPEISTETATITPAHCNLIALGNVNDNRLIARLYFNGYAYEDSLLPGETGFTVRTVHDPYPWHGQGHVVVLGVSDAVRAAEAAAWFTAHIRPGKTRAGVDYLLHVSTAAEPTAAQQRALAAEQTPSFHVFLDSASKYLKTGRDVYARHAIATLQRIVERYRGTTDLDCDWPEETSSAEILAAWDAFEECPLLSASQRRDFTLAMLQFLRSLQPHVSGYAALGKHDLVTWNHTTFPLLGLYFGSRYFADYYRLPETQPHLEKARACLLAQARSWKPQEDADGYFTITMRHAIQYCLAEWRLEFFESGRLRQYADYLIGICDSAGLPAGFGDSGIGLKPTLIQGSLPIAFWWYRDPGYLWVLNHVSDGRWPNPYHRDVVPQRPDRHDGVRVFPLDAQLYEYTRRHPVYNEPLAPPNIPLAAAFDKIALRESLDPEAQYLLLDGYARGKHLHFDGNAIIELVDRGERWLLDHDYLTRNTTEHNMLSVVQDGRSLELVPSCASLECQADVGGTMGLVGTAIRDYCGVEWRRFLFWRKGGALVVLDRMRARKEAHYDLDLVWKVEDRGAVQLLDDGVFVVERSAAESSPPPDASSRTVDAPAASTARRFWVKWPDAVAATMKQDSPKGIVVPVRKLFQRTAARMREGDVAEVANLLYVDEASQPVNQRLARLGPGAALLLGDEDALCAVRGAKIPGLEFDADMLYLSRSHIAWANGRSLAWGQTRLAGDAPSAMEAELKAPRATARSADGQPATVRMTGLSPEACEALLASLRGNVASAPPRVAAAQPPAPAQWKTRLPGGGPVRRLRLADVAGADPRTILVAAGNAAYALRSDGRVAWTYAMQDACYDVEAGELAANPGREIAVAGGDAHGHLLDCNGRLLSKRAIRGAVWNQNFGDRPWRAYTVGVRDLDQDGANEILLGTQNFELHIYDPNWNLLSRSRRAVLHGSIDLLTEDVDRDGKLEVLATDHYGHVQVFRHDGGRAGDFYTSIGDVQAALADLDGDRRVEVIHGCSTGDLVCWKLNSQTPWRRGAAPLWRFDNFGYGVNRLRAADVDADGQTEIIVASQTGYLYVLDNQGRVRWQDRAGTDIVEAVVVRGAQPQLAYCDRGGVLTLATGDGRMRKRVALDLIPAVAVSCEDTLIIGGGGDVVSLSLTAAWESARE